VRDVRLGIAANPDQRDFYLCDNVVEGRLVWPHVYSDDGGAHSDDDGIRVEGDGHVVCHNVIAGFGDAMKIGQAGSRAVDFYGNEVLSAYDNGLELDGSEGNTRAFREPLHEHLRDAQLPADLRRAGVRAPERRRERRERAAQVPRLGGRRRRSRAGCSSTTTPS
jgi:hypothetical protein